MVSKKMGATAWVERLEQRQTELTHVFSAELQKAARVQMSATASAV